MYTVKEIIKILRENPKEVIIDSICLLLMFTGVFALYIFLYCFM